MDKKEYSKWYYETHKKEILEQHKQYVDKNREKYREYKRESYQRNKEKILVRHKVYYENNLEKRKEYTKTPIARANNLLSQYKRIDKNKGWSEVDFDARWIVDNIFSKPCEYCGETDWHKLGCDRKDNSKGHTKDNVVPCCYHCNCKKYTMSYHEYLKKIDDNITI